MNPSSYPATRHFGGLKPTYVIGLFLISLCILAYSKSNVADSRLLLNPIYKIKRMSTGIVIAYANQDGKEVKHEFKEIYADIVLAAYRKQTLNQIIPQLAKKYYFSEIDCRREVKHAVNTLEEWKIILPTDKNFGKH